MIMSSNPAHLPPGFRFHPTDEELIQHYLRNRAASSPCPVAIIADVDIYKFDPWDLPPKAMYGDREWYFFTPRDRKYPNGIRPNRAAGTGYWKATGTDKPIKSGGGGSIGVKKALVFYKGRPPKGTKTNWIMHEYRLADAQSSNTYKPMKFRNASMRLDDWVLCRIYKKSSQMSPAMAPPLMDHEQEDAISEDNIYASPTMQHQQAATAAMFPDHHQQMRMHRALTSEFGLEDYTSLAQLFDGVPEQSTSAALLSGHYPSSMNGQFLMMHSSNNNNNSASSSGGHGNLMPQMMQMDAAAVCESSVKRKSDTGEDDQAYFSQDGNELSLSAAKRLNSSCLIPTSLHVPQANSPLQNVSLSQQLLLNSNLGMH